MADHLIEIVFRNVSIEKIEAILNELSSHGRKVINSTCTCHDLKISWGKEKSIEKMFKENETFGLFINLDELKTDDICLPNCGLAIYKDENSINLEINFQLSSLSHIEVDGLSESLMKLAKSISTRYQITDYFCGLEPAQDTQTRLFTKEEIGPLFL